MKIRIKVSLKQIPSFLIAIIRHSQSAQNSKSLQYFWNIKEGRHEVHFLHADKQTFLHADTINIGEYG